MKKLARDLIFMEYKVDLSTLNSSFGSDASGEATLTLDAPTEDTRTLKVQIDASGLEDLSDIGGVHVAHIHGQFLGNADRPLLEQGDGSFFDRTGREAVNSILPTVADSDVDGDGFVNFLEGRPNYGPVVLNLTSEQIDSAPEGTPPLTQFLNLATAGEINPADLFPSGTEFNLDTTYTFDLTDPDQLRQYNNLTPLDEREVVIHGLTIPTETSEAIDETAMGTAPAGIDLGNGEAFRITAPVAAGEIEAQASTDVSQLVALTDHNSLVSFDSNNPGASQFIDVTGVEGTLLGIDTRPADGSIYGISTANNIYTIDADSGIATYISTLDTPFEGGTISGFDFNPVADRLRLVGDNDQDFRINVDTGEVTVDESLAFGLGDSSKGVNPNVTAAAYTNSFDGTISTQLYDIDTLLNDLALQDPPNDGTLTTVGDLGIDFDTLGGFDIVSTVEGDNTAFAVSNTTLYSLDLDSGAAHSLGEVGSINPLNLQGLTAVQGDAKTEFSLPLEEAQTVPEVPDTAAEGSFDAVLDGNTLTVTGEFSDLTSNLAPVGGVDSVGDSESPVHIHVGEAGDAGPILRNLSVVDNGDNSGSFTGNFELSPEDAALVEDNGVYINLHTENNPDGELRGQVEIQDETNTEPLIDLTDLNDSKLSFNVNENTLSNSTIGFYEVDAAGGVIDSESGEVIAVGDSGYTETAIANRLDVDLNLDGKSTEFTEEFAKGSTYAPFVVVDGTIAELEDGDNSNDPTVYFPYAGVNFDGIEHIRSLGDNIFGIENLPNSGDLNLDDLVVDFDFV